MNVLSLFDGMSCGQIALNRAGIKYDNYYKLEIENKHAIQSNANKLPEHYSVGQVWWIEC